MTNSCTHFLTRVCGFLFFFFFSWGGGFLGLIGVLFLFDSPVCSFSLFWQCGIWGCSFWILLVSYLKRQVCPVQHWTQSSTSSLVGAPEKFQLLGLGWSPWFFLGWKGKNSSQSTSWNFEKFRYPLLTFFFFLVCKVIQYGSCQAMRMWWLALTIRQ